MFTKSVQSPILSRFGNVVYIDIYNPAIDERTNAIPYAVAIFYAFHAVCATHAKDPAACYKSMQSVYTAFANKGFYVAIHPHLPFVCFTRGREFEYRSYDREKTKYLEYFIFENETLPPRVKAAIGAALPPAQGAAGGGDIKPPPRTEDRQQSDIST